MKMEVRILEATKSMMELIGSNSSLDRFVDSIKGAEILPDRAVLETEDFLIIVKPWVDSFILFDLAGKGEDNHPLLRELGVVEDSLRDFSRNGFCELKLANKFFYLLASGLKKFKIDIA